MSEMTERRRRRYSILSAKLVTTESRADAVVLKMINLQSTVDDVNLFITSEKRHHDRQLITVSGQLLSRKFINRSFTKTANVFICILHIHYEFCHSVFSIYK